MIKSTKALAGLFLLIVLAGLIYYFKMRPEVVGKQKITIGMVTFPGYAPLYLAKEKGLFGNLDVELVRIEGIGDLRAAMRSNKLDMYLATPDIYQATEDQEPVGIAFLAIDESHGADGVAVSDQIKTVTDLRGKKVGAEPGFPPYFVLQYMLHEKGMTLNDLDFKDLASQDAGNAFVAKQIDAVGTYEPYLSKSVDLREKSKVLVSSADLPGLIVDLIYANENLIKNNPEAIKQVADGWFKALNYYNENKRESIQIMSKAFGVSPDEMEEIKSGVSWLDLSNNKQLFDKNAKNNIFNTFDLVNEILVSNNPNNIKVTSSDRITDVVIQLY